MSYKTQLERTWWLKHAAFRRYMLREATVLPLVFALCCLLAGLWSLQTSAQFYAWQQFMAQPWVVAFNLLALIGALYHAFTFFQLFPRVMPIRVGNKQVPATLIVLAQWLGVVAVLLAMLWLAASGVLGGWQ